MSGRLRRLSDVGRAMRPIRRSARTLVAGALSAVVVTTFLHVPPAEAAPPGPSKSSVRLDKRTPAPPPKSTAWPAKRAAGAVRPAPVWPKAGTARVTLPDADREQATARAVPLDGLPVRVAPTAKTQSPAQVDVEVLDRAKMTAWRDGLVVRITPVAPVLAAADLPINLSIDYQSFRYAYGGTWASRLQLWQLPPACAERTVAQQDCRPSPLTSVNNAADGTVTAEVAAAPAGTLVALAAAPSGPEGDFAATSLAPSATWASGGSTGEFTWSYPMRVPPSLGGPTPNLALSYSSSNTDGRSSAENNQPSWVGEGFEYSPGFIERSYVPCVDDMTGGNNSERTGDLCWRSYNATMSLNGTGTELVFQEGKGWHARDENGAKIEKLSGASNGAQGGEHWKVTTTDGFEYFFGRNSLPGQTSTTNSTWTVPVAGNHDNEPCHSNSGGFDDSFCTQAWRWNLDYVVDPHGNTMSYWYNTETNYYAKSLGEDDNVSYIRGGTLRQIDYGTWDRTLPDGTTSRSAQPTARVVFESDNRCESDCGTHEAAQWKDVPWDQDCGSATADCEENFSPTFWSTKRLAKVTTRVWDTTKSPADWQDVDSWTLDHTYPAVGDGSEYAGMWLNKIVHTGHVTNTDSTGPTPLTPVSLPPVTFEPTALPNRVLADHNTTNNRHRIGNIITETGSKIQVTYRDPECTDDNLPSAPHTNTKLCYPVVGPDPANPTGPEIREWWHKYVVEQVSEYDLQVNVDGVDHSAPPKHTHYTYLEEPAWHYADDDGLVKPKRKTWNQFRGYRTVETRVGEAPSQTLTVTTYLRGMHGDRQSPAGGTRNETVPASLGNETVQDEEQFAGMVREQVVYNGVASKPVSKTVNVPWRSPALASRTINGDTVTARFTNITTTYTATALGTDGQDGWRTTRTQSTFDDTYGTLKSVRDDGDIAKTGDEKCTTHHYNRNTAKNLTNTVKQTTVTTLACGTNPANTADIISDTRNYYDGKTSINDAPSKGTITKVETLKDWTTPAGTVWQTTATSTYDPFGRIRTATDVRGNITTTAYTPETGGPVTKVTTVTPDPNGNPNGWTSSADTRPYWDSPIKTTDPNGRVNEMTYDPLGRLTKVWKVGWDRANRENAPSVWYTYHYAPTRNAYPYITTKTLHAGGNYRTSYEIFDALLRPRQTQTEAVGGGRVVADTRYDRAGRAELTYAPHHEVGTAEGGLWGKAEWHVPAVTKTVYDNASRPVTEILLSSGSTPVSLEEKWRTTTVHSGDTTRVTPPDGGTPTTSVTDAQGRTVEFRQHTTSQGVDGPYQSTRYTYNAKDQLVTVADPDGNEWTYTFDVKGRQIQAKDPDKGTTTSEYNDYNDLIKTIDARGEILAYDYDPIGRKTGIYDDAVAPATKRAEWKYDKLATGPTFRGQLTETIRYDPPGSNTQYKMQIRGMNARYQATSIAHIIPPSEGAVQGTWTFLLGYSPYDGSPTTTTYPAAGGLGPETINTSYDPTTGLPTKLTSTAIGVGGYVTNQQYTPFGEPYRTTRAGTIADPVQDTTTYEEATRRIVRTDVKFEAAAEGHFLSDRRYEYDAAGNVESITESPYGGPVDTQCFRYDTLRRLTSAWTPKTGVTCETDASVANLGGPAPYWHDWTFDKVGNRLTETVHTTTGNTTRNYTVPTGGKDVVRPHAVTAVTTQATGQPPVVTNYGHDAAGNTTCRPTDATGNTCPPGTNSQHLAWDAENRLTTISGDAPTAGSNIYDADGTRLLRRDATGTTLYLPGQELRQEGTTTATRYYTFAGQLVASRTPTSLDWTYTDHQGTQHTTIDAAGEAVTTRRQTPYGQPRGIQAPWPNPKGFVGGDTDPNGLTHLGAREYDPVLGRFISVDPLLVIDDPRQYNGYQYGGNSPITNSDPTGLAPVCGHGAACEKGNGSSAGPPPPPTSGGGSGTPSTSKPNPNPATGPEPILTPAEWLEGVYRPVWRQRPGAIADLGSMEIREGLLQYFCHYNPDICRAQEKADQKLAIDILLEVSGIADGKKCLEGNAMGCVWTAVGLLGVGKLKSLKLIDEVVDGAKTACSFSGDTKVLMADGTLTAIKDIRVGDLVLAADPQAEEQGAHKVTHLWVHEDDLVNLQAAGGEVTTTEDHPFWNYSEQRWQEAGELGPSDLLLTAVGDPLSVAGLVANTAVRGTAYNLTVADIPTYYVLVGDDPVLVHNTGAPGTCDLNFPPFPSGKTAAHVNGDYFLSGYADEVPPGFQRVPLEEILKVSENIGNLRTPMMFDNAAGDGAYYLSHAEIQAAVAHPGHPIDVTRPMCDMCWDFMSNQGRYGGVGPVMVKDPSGLYVFGR